MNPALDHPEVASRLAVMKAKATIVPDHLHGAFVTTHPAVAGTAWKLTLGSGEDIRLRPAVLPPEGTTFRSASPAAAAPVRATARDVAAVMLTSGTTAAPKVVPLTHANLASSIDGIRTTYRLGPADATLVGLPPSHVHGRHARLLATLPRGARP